MLHFKGMRKKHLFLTLFVLLLTILGVILLLFPRGDTGNQRTGPFIVCLDAGHGGDDPGAVSPDGRQEKDDVLAMALAVEQKLLAMADPQPESERDKIRVILTRYEDYSPTLEDRYTFANNQNATVFVSIHRNSGGGAGVEVWIQNDASPEESALGKAVLDNLVGCGVTKNRGLRKGTPSNSDADFAVNRGTLMPACLIELGFMDHEPDNLLFDEHFDAYAQAIADGIMRMR